jgi:hypothetical protein
MFNSLIGSVARPSFRFPSLGHGDPGQLGGSLPLGTASADAISKLGRSQLHFWDAFVHHLSVICVISKTTVVQWVTSVLDSGRPLTTLIPPSRKAMIIASPIFHAETSNGRGPKGAKRTCKDRPLTLTEKERRRVSVPPNGSAEVQTRVTSS